MKLNEAERLAIVEAWIRRRQRDVCRACEGFPQCGNPCLTCFGTGRVLFVPLEHQTHLIPKWRRLLRRKLARVVRWIYRESLREWDFYE